MRKPLLIAFLLLISKLAAADTVEQLRALADNSAAKQGPCIVFFVMPADARDNRGKPLRCGACERAKSVLRGAPNVNVMVFDAPGSGTSVPQFFFYVDGTLVNSKTGYNNESRDSMLALLKGGGGAPAEAAAADNRESKIKYEDAVKGFTIDERAPLFASLKGNYQFQQAAVEVPNVVIPGREGQAAFSYDSKTLGQMLYFPAGRDAKGEYKEALYQLGGDAQKPQVRAVGFNGTYNTTQGEGFTPVGLADSKLKDFKHPDLKLPNVRLIFDGAPAVCHDAASCNTAGAGGTGPGTVAHNGAPAAAADPQGVISESRDFQRTEPGRYTAGTDEVGLDTAGKVVRRADGKWKQEEGTGVYFMKGDKLQDAAGKDLGDIRVLPSDNEKDASTVFIGMPAIVTINGERYFYHRTGDLEKMSDHTMTRVMIAKVDAPKPAVAVVAIVKSTAAPVIELAVVSTFTPVTVATVVSTATTPAPPDVAPNKAKMQAALKAIRGLQGTGAAAGPALVAAAKLYGTLSEADKQAVDDERYALTTAIRKQLLDKADAKNWNEAALAAKILLPMDLQTINALEDGRRNPETKTTAVAALNTIRIAAIKTRMGPLKAPAPNDWKPEEMSSAADAAMEYASVSDDQKSQLGPERGKIESFIAYYLALPLPVETDEAKKNKRFEIWNKAASAAVNIKISAADFGAVKTFLEQGMKIPELKVQAAHTYVELFNEDPITHRKYTVVPPPPL